LITRRLCAIFFLSGASALVFENIWFRQAGLAFGNSVWATSIVLASFMGGLGLGNALAAHRGAHLDRPIRAYAGLELVVGVSGVLVAFTLPRVGLALVPLFRGLTESPGALNTVRLVVAFAMLVLPATAMGMTLPVLTKALMRSHPHFGENLGALYGWNTLGAVTGALGVETILVTHLGVRGSALAAGSLSLVAASLALTTSWRFEGAETGEPAPTQPVLDGEARRLLAAAFVTGAMLLALEVVWFRFLVLFSVGSSLTFALLLAVVLLGIAAGGLLASAWLKAAPTADEWLGALLVGAGLLVIVPYTSFNSLLPMLNGLYFHEPGPVSAMAAWLTLPVSLLSGVVFTFLGSALNARLGVETAAAGLLTLANTAGAMLGALAAGFVLLPALGMERSFALLAAGYGVAALLVPASWRLPRSLFGSRLAWGLLGTYVLFLVFFPYGLMAATYIRLPLLKLGRENLYVDAVREGLTETALYVRQTEQGETLHRRLVTNGFSMSGTGWDARRYMGLYVYLPVALHPRLKSALLISYGMGSTARALVETPELESVDVVDISKDVLDLAPLAFDDPRDNPLLDRRVRVHVEDGRAFLQATDRRYDLITSEPPPPKNAGVVNLYSQEYFELLHRHLAEGGMVTYWLPVHALNDQGTRVVVRAFCNAFSDCSLWSGLDLDWMLVGTRNARGPVSVEHLRRQWEDPKRAATLRDVGLDGPEQLGASFLADATGLAALAGGAPALADDWPNRLGPVEAEVAAFVRPTLVAPAARQAFATSSTVTRLWPESMRAATLDAFDPQDVYYEILDARLSERPVPRDRLHSVVTQTKLCTVVLRLLGTDPDHARVAKVKAARGELSTWVRRQLAILALAERDFARAADEATLALVAGSGPDTVFLRAYTACLAGRRTEALPLLSGMSDHDRDFLRRTFDLD
jgi:spermidine synthase